MTGELVILLEKPVEDGESYLEHIQDWIDSVSDLGVKALVVLGPNHAGTQDDREVIAVWPPNLINIANVLSRSNSFGIDWRTSNSPLSGFNNLRSAKSEWELKFLEEGFFSVVRLEFSSTLNRSFECYMLCDRDMKDRGDAAAIVYAMLGAWPLLKKAISMGRLKITERETESLILAAEGLTANQAAKKMGCTERTINFHWSNVVKKLGAENKMSAVQRANWIGLI